MLSAFVFSFLLLQASAAPAQSPQGQQVTAPTSTAKAQQVIPGKRQQLVKVRRIYVESFGSSEAAQQLQAMVIASLTETSQFTVTEDKAKADAILEGFAGEKSSQEVSAYKSATAAGRGAIEDSTVDTKTIDNAKASVRLVNQDGDVIWTTTQESQGAKFKGASADVADKIVKQLLRDIEKPEKPAEGANEAK